MLRIPSALWTASLLVGCASAAASGFPDPRESRAVGPDRTAARPAAEDATAIDASGPAGLDGDPLESYAAWDGAGPERRRDRAASLAESLPGLRLLRMETFECASERHEIAVFLHAATRLEMCLVPGGERKFVVSDVCDEEVFRSERTGAFLVARTEMTCAAWARITAAPAPELGDLPVALPYDDAVRVCSSAGLELPTSVQWEHAAHGAAARDWFGDDTDSAAAYGWLLEESGRRPQAVGGKLPNAVGLHDVVGNLREWCRDEDAEPNVHVARGSSFDRRSPTSLRRIPATRAAAFGVRPVLEVRFGSEAAARASARGARARGGAGDGPAPADPTDR